MEYIEKLEKSGYGIVREEKESFIESVLAGLGVVLVIVIWAIIILCVAAV